MKPACVTATRLAAALCVSTFLANRPAAAQGAGDTIVHDAEYYVLQAQHAEQWAAEDREIDRKLAELRQKYGTPPNIITILWDDTAVGQVGIPAIQKTQGWETPNMNRLAAEGINFMRMYSEPSCTPTRAALLTGREPVRNGMYNVGFPYEYGGLAASEVTVADVLSKEGYATALYGKYHLGDIEASYPINHGFDEALWMPYNQVVSLYNPPGQMNALLPATLLPQLYPKDPYDIDQGWRPQGFVNALEGTKGGSVREFGTPANLADYAKIDPEGEKRAFAFIERNAAAKKPFLLEYWPAALSFLGFPNRVTTNGGLPEEAMARVDMSVGRFMDELKKLGIAENTLVVVMADNGPIAHGAPPGFIQTLYRGGKGDFLEGGVRVPAMAWWPGVITPGQTVGDIIQVTDLFTTFAHLGHATANIPTDRIIDGVDQTALFLDGDTHSRRDYVFVYTGNVLAATVKGRYKRVWVGDKPGLSGAAFYDLYTDPREEDPKLVPMLPTKGMFDIMRARHQLWMQKYPNTPEARAFPLTGIENPRPAVQAASQPRIDASKLPFDPYAFIKLVPGWAGVEFDQAE